MGLFRTFGTNALVAYFTHGMLALAVWAFIPSTARLPTARALLCAFRADLDPGPSARKTPDLHQALSDRLPRNLRDVPIVPLRAARICTL